MNEYTQLENILSNTLNKLAGEDTNNPERPIIKDVIKTDELYYMLNDVIGIDDGKKFWQYTNKEIIAEAKYSRDKYLDASWTVGENCIGINGKEAQRESMKEYNQLKKFLRKWDK